MVMIGQIFLERSLNLQTNVRGINSMTRTEKWLFAEQSQFGFVFDNLQKDKISQTRSVK